MLSTQTQTQTLPQNQAERASAALEPEAKRPPPRAIEAVYRAPELHWVGDGFRVAGYFSEIPDAARKLSPFLLLDYHPPFQYAASSKPRGVGVHPHRGFETVSIAWQGSVAHHDSAGHGGVIGPGDVQWMTAASGILHKEYHEAEFARQGGTFQMAQLWVNLPRAHKMDPPGYQALTAADMGQLELPGGAGQVRVVAGEHQGVRGPARTFTPIVVLDVRLRAGKEAHFALPERYNTALLVMSGSLSIAGQSEVTSNDFVLFRNEGEEIALSAASDAHLLLLSGEPIDEPVVQYGPFVMNSEREIVQAFADFNNGKFGELDD